MKLAERTFHRNDFRLTSPFGMRTHPVTKVQKLHSGADYGTQGQKWEQFALEDGIVLNAGVDAYGYNALFAWVSYPRLNIKCLYYHLDKVFVSKGQKVNENTIIGLTGTSGLSTGIHLHLGVKHLDDDKYFDPETYDYQIKTDGIRIGDKVKIIGTHYATGQRVPYSVRLRTHTVQAINNEKVLLREIVSWVFIKDLKEV